MWIPEFLEKNQSESTKYLTQMEFRRHMVCALGMSVYGSTCKSNMHFIRCWI